MDQLKVRKRRQILVYVLLKFDQEGATENSGTTTKSFIWTSKDEMHAKFKQKNFSYLNNE